MNHASKVGLAAVLAALAAMSGWQWVEIRSLRAEVEALANRAMDHRPAALPRVSSSPEGPLEPPAGQSARERIRQGKAARDERRTAMEKELEEARLASASKAPSVLTPERRRELLEGRVLFRPGPIEESQLPVTEATWLQRGQALQVKYGANWYAGEVIGFESDGGIHVRYFGWGPDWDEIVPRSDLRLDPQARERAVETHGGSSANF